MSKIDDLRHIRDSAQEALFFVKNRAREDLDNDNRMLAICLFGVVQNGAPK